jgi:DNA repair ATPase RecN
MKNIKENLSMMISDLIDRAEYAELSSEDRIEQMAKIDNNIELLFELISELQQDYDALEAEEKAYQERKARLRDKIFNARAVFSRKYDADENKLIQLSYDISAKMNALRAKSRRTELEEEQLIKLQEQLDDIARILAN